MRRKFGVTIGVSLMMSCLNPALRAEEASEAKAQSLRKVLFIGDSITLHPPAESLGWMGNWGMAASEREKDYVHLFYSALCKVHEGKTPELVMSGRDVAPAGRLDQTLEKMEQLQSVNADLIVVQLGENDNSATDLETFEDLYERLIVGLRGEHSPIILCLGVWNPTQASDPHDVMIRRVCERTGAHFVPITPVPSGSAALFEERYTNEGVNWHPGDKGMKHYADALWRVCAPLLGH